MVESKKTIRKAMQTAFSKLEEKDHDKISEQLQAVLFASDLWKKSQSVGIYLSVGKEWDTRTIVERALEERKRVAVPKTIPDTKELVFYEMTDWTQIIEDGHFGLDEPDIEKTVPMAKDNIDLLIVPGLVFTENGYRVGFGGGYYDRFLTDFIHPTASLVHTKQIIESFPIESFDIPVHYLITEQGMIG